MNGDYKVKRLTRLYDSCNRCGLPIVNCICESANKITSRAKFWFLSSEREFYRPSNTARLMKLINPESTEIYLWERTRTPEKLVEDIKSGKNDVYILFPALDEELKSRQVEYRKTEREPAFIILDGTWKEARRIFRKSEFLKDLPIISLEPSCKSKFDLRRGADEGELCTIEAAIEILRHSGETDNADIIEAYYSLFIKSYKAGASGHKLKDY